MWLETFCYWHVTLITEIKITDTSTTTVNVTIIAEKSIKPPDDSRVTIP
jgi:hypothetical protein